MSKFHYTGCSFQKFPTLSISKSEDLISHFEYLEIRRFNKKSLKYVKKNGKMLYFSLRTSPRKSQFLNVLLSLLRRTSYISSTQKENVKS